MPVSTQFYINGQWVDPSQPDDHPVINPSNEEVCATISLGSEADTNAAVAAAKAAFDGWAATPVADRIAALERLRDVYKKRSDEMAEAISTEMGAPIDLARQQQVGAGIWHLDGTLNAARSFAWDHPLGDHAPSERIVYEPVGVCALITPWNWPMNQIVLKCAPALVTGNTMVLKPSEIAPLSGLLFAEMMDEADLPPRCLQSGQWRRAGRGQHAVGASGCGHGELHRLHPGRPPDFHRRSGHDQARQSGAWRQGREHHLRRCR